MDGNADRCDGFARVGHFVPEPLFFHHSRIRHRAESVSGGRWAGYWGKITQHIMKKQLTITGFSAAALAQEALNPGFIKFIKNQVERGGYSFPMECTLDGKMLSFPSGAMMNAGWFTDEPCVTVTLVNRQK